MTLVDTSAWVDFFRDRGSVAEQVDHLLETNEVALCGPVITELRRGLRSAKERRRVIPLLDGCVMLAQPADLWQAAGDLGFALARRGVTVKSLDLLIATYALSHDVALLSADSDFSQMKNAGIPLMVV